MISELARVLQAPDRAGRRGCWAFWGRWEEKIEMGALSYKLKSGRVGQSWAGGSSAWGAAEGGTLLGRCLQWVCWESDGSVGQLSGSGSSSSLLG